MRIVYFTHSLVSCWNHGNAHFQRGVLRELQALGHDVAAWEPADGWSRANLVADHGTSALHEAESVFEEIPNATYGSAEEAEAALDGADLVIVHEWTAPDVVRRIGAARRRGGRFRLLFHDTHHRAVSHPAAMRALDLDAYDGVLAFGESLAEVYRRWGWGDRVFVWHEAADTRLFRPPDQEGGRAGLVWVGNWGDGERTAELEAFLLRPAGAAGLPLTIHGVRYPPEALELIERHGGAYSGWLPNHRAPEVFARHLATVHVPRRSYVETLPGIPTIRVFEALAAGLPLAVALWRDTEGLFRPGDYLRADDEEEMTRHLRALAADPELRAELRKRGLETIRARHSCAHRAAELVDIARGLGAPGAGGMGTELEETGT